MFKVSTKPEVDIHSHLKYRFRLNFYDKPPLDDIIIEDFETFALDRLRVLAEIETAFVRNSPWETIKKHTEDQCRKYLELNQTTAKTKDLDRERQKDHISHFVLRLAFCRTDELRRRFVKAETTLFRIRYADEDPQELTSFLKSRDFDWVEVSSAEIEQYRDQLDAVAGKGSDTFYKVKWTRVPDLVEKRKVFLKGGMAYVSSKEQSSIIFQSFQTHLEKALELTAKALPKLDEDTRIVPILDHLSQGFLAGGTSEWNNATSANGDEITADMVDDISRKHFPACMRNLHNALKRDRHMKHFGRLQYGLFLKVLGLSIDEAITFWRRGMSTIQDDKFNKEYKYNIRHSYGLEGKRANYPAKSCQQILMNDQPGSGDSHGCPYRHFSPENLQTALLSMYSSQGLTSADIPEIMQIVKGGHYHVACTRVFEITHAKYGIRKDNGVGDGESVTHPNQYAAKSRELELGATKGAVKKETASDGDVAMS